ncbi:MAG: hypothetical protein LBE92_10310 [Chryseobacterium sp.]|jgi:C-terminal processing protease CtpA/Prc|uniref:S41 family peptidase n=1 Tax=Chryseobacterium sp. TaxID=1871047 RepID=UPI00281C89FD|nr:S41 family peptidase [Chryseobacterium sp.]MDR2236508.1 hypothetical protein [Chryseobacterium sp.]
MRKYSLFILFFLSLNFSARILSETQKLESLCRIWGFLKYYHPHVAKGDLNWDQQLLKKIDEIETVQDKAQLNSLYFNWINSLGKVENCKPCSKTDKSKTYFLKNFDLSWIRNSDVFSEQVSQQLLFIENNRNIGNHYYLGRNGRKSFFRNEISYGSQYTSKQISLLELFRYWNFVEYFFPYKYETDQNWNEVLTEMIPRFLSIGNDESYHLTLAELVTKVDDSHAFLYSPLINLNLYGRRKVPVEYRYAEGKLIITAIHKNSFNEPMALKKGDVIYDIDGRTIPQIVNALEKYVPASNSWGKITKTKNLFLNTNKDSITIKIEREGQNIAFTAKTYLLKDIIREKPAIPEKWKFLDAERMIGYVHMGIIEKKDLDDMYRELKSASSIIFDLRNYPKQTIIPLSKLILPVRTPYYRFTFPEPGYPGKFYTLVNHIGQKNPDYYKGNVVILVDENTQSQAETTAVMLKQHPKAKVIGSNTSGANGDVTMFKIAELDTWFSGLGAYYPDWRETQRIGIVPEIIIRPTVKGIREGKDEVLERALEYVKTGH